MHRQVHGSYRIRKQQKVGGGVQQIIKKILRQTIHSEEGVNSLEKELLIHKPRTINLALSKGLSQY